MPSLYGQSGNVTVNSSNTTGLYAIANTANVVTANISSVNTTGLYGLASNVFVPSSAQQLLNLLSNNGTVIFALDPAYANQKVEAFATGGGSGNLIINLVGDVTGLGSTGAPLFTTLSNTGVVSGTYGNSAYWPTFTVSANGRIMTASTGNLASYLSGNVSIGNLAVTGNTSSNSIIITTGIFYANGTPFVSSSYGNANVAAFLPTYGGNITANNVTVTGNLRVTGNVLVTGNTFYTNVNTIVTTTIVANSTTDSTSTSTGAIISFGGLGVAANIYANKINSETGFFYAGNGQPYYGNATVAAYLPVNPTWTGYLTFANANAATQATSINSINANLGAYQTYANTQISTINANLGAYQIYANANAASQQTQINTLQTQVYANSNVAAYLLGNTRQGNIQANTVNLGPFGNFLGNPNYSGRLNIQGGTGSFGYGANLTLTSNLGADSEGYAYTTIGSTVNNLSGSQPFATGTPAQTILTGNILVPRTAWIGNAWQPNNRLLNATNPQAALFEGNVSFNFDWYTKNPNSTVQRVVFYNPVTIGGFNSNLNVSGGANVVVGDGLNGGNITVATGGYYLGDGSKLTGVVSTYGNTQVAAYLPTYTGNLSPSNLFTNNIRFANGQPYNFGSTYSNANVAAYLITNTGNIAAGNFFSDNYLYANGVSILTGIGGTYSNVNVAAYIPTDPTITGIQANVGLLYLGNISTNANLGAFETYANVTFSTVANAASQQTQIDTNTTGLSTLNANVGAYQTYANANAATQATSINTINANLGAYQTFANTNFASAACVAVISTKLNNLDANVGAYETYANVTFSNFANYANVTFSTVTNAASQQTQINSLSSGLTLANTAIDTINANLGAFETYANATFVTSGGTYSNANVASYLPTYSGDLNSVGNINAQQIIAQQIYTPNTITTEGIQYNQYPATTYIKFVDVGPSTGQVNLRSAGYITARAPNLSFAGLTQTEFDSGAGSVLNAIVDVNGLGYPRWTFYGNIEQPYTIGYNNRANLANVITSRGIFWANGVDYSSTITGTYGNTQVAAYLPTDPTFTGYLTFANANAASQATSINSINANLGAYQIYGNATFSTQANAASQQTSINSINANLGAYQTYGNVTFSTQSNAATQQTQIDGILNGTTTLANVISTAGYFWANGTPFAGSYGNTQVAAYLNGSTSVVRSNSTNLTISGDSAYLILSPSAVGGVAGPVLYAANSSNLAAGGGVYSVNGYFWANGTAYSTASTYGNTQVAAFLPTYSGSLNSLANVQSVAGYFWANGTPYATSGGSYGNTQVAAFLPVYGGPLLANVITGPTSSDLTLQASLARDIRILGAAGGASDILLQTSDGGITIDASSGSGSYAATIKSAALISLLAPNVTTNGQFTSTGGYFWSNGTAYSTGAGSYGNANVAAYLPTYTGNISAGNISTTGNTQSAYFLGSAAKLTSLTGVSAGTYGNDTTIPTIVVDATGRITQITTNAISGGGSYGNSNVAAYLAGTISVGNILSTSGYFWANGTAYSTGGGNTYGNTEVAAYLPTYTGSLDNSSTIQTINANLGAYQTYANVTFSTVANAASQQTSIDSINANLGAYQTYGNLTFSTQANAASQQTQIDTNTTGLATLNANVGAYQTYGNVTFSTIANAASQQTQIDGITNGTTTLANVLSTGGYFWANGTPYSTGGSSGVTQIVAGGNITIDPPGGTGIVTITATGAAGPAGPGFSGNLAGNILYDSINERIIANAFPLSTANISVPNNTISRFVVYDPVYTNGQLQQPPLANATVGGTGIVSTSAQSIGFVQTANIAMQSGYGFGSQNRDTTNFLSTMAVTPVTANSMSTNDRVRGGVFTLDYVSNAITWGTMSTASQNASPLAALNAFVNLNGAGSIGAAVGGNYGVQITPPATGTNANVQYATGLLAFTNLFSTAGTTGKANVVYSRGVAPFITGFSSNLTVQNAIGLHTYSGWAGSGTVGSANNPVVGRWALLNEDQNTTIQTNGNVILGNGTSGYGSTLFVNSRFANVTSTATFSGTTNFTGTTNITGTLAGVVNKGNTAYAAGFGTSVTTSGLNLQATFTSANIAQIGPVSGSITYSATTTEIIGGVQTVRNVVGNTMSGFQGITPTNAGLNSLGDNLVAIVSDQTNGVVYRITYVKTSIAGGAGSPFAGITIERLI